MLTDELADLIDEEQQTEVAVLLGIDVFFHFRGKRFHRNIDVIVEDSGADNIRSQSRVNLFGHLQGKVKATGSKAGYVALPIIAFALDILLKLLELAIVVEGFLQILSQGEVERVVATLGIELIPEDGGESRGLVGIGIVNVADVEQYHLHVGFVDVPVL